MGANYNRNSNIIIFTICLLFICVGNIHSQISVPNPSIDLHLDLENVEYESVKQKKWSLIGMLKAGRIDLVTDLELRNFFERGHGYVCRTII